MDKVFKEQVQALCDFAMAVPAEQRDAWLVRECGSDAQLLVSAREMLASLMGGGAQQEQAQQAVPPKKEARIPDSGVESGQDIGPYRIEECIGAGGMGVVYRAFDTRLERQVALKFLPVHLQSDALAHDRFLAEARAASKLDHPHICGIYDIGNTEKGAFYMAMPFYQGEPLSTRISRGPVPLDEAIDIAIQIADGLSAAHAVEIVHRDIKPANIMLTPGSVKILDFGIAKVADVNLTGTGISVGTLAYMSPEQLRGDKVDARTDVWAAGATLYEMVTGKRAFPADTLHKTIHEVLYTDNDPTKDLSEKLMPLQAVLRRAMSREIENRYTSANDFLDDLLAVRQSGKNVSPTAVTTRAPQHGRYEWDSEVLDAIANLVTPYMGPIAQVLVKRIARQNATVDELAVQLAEQLPEEQQRTRFRQRFAAEVAVRTTPPVPMALKTDGTQFGLVLSPLQQAKLEAEFIPFIGPIAPVLIKRQAGQSDSIPKLCASLAEMLPSEEERKTFLSRLGKEFTE